MQVLIYRKKIPTSRSKLLPATAWGSILWNSNILDICNKKRIFWKHSTGHAASVKEEQAEDKMKPNRLKIKCYQTKTLALCLFLLMLSKLLSFQHFLLLTTFQHLYIGEVVHVRTDTTVVPLVSVRWLWLSEVNHPSSRTSLLVFLEVVFYVQTSPAASMVFLSL